MPAIVCTFSSFLASLTFTDIASSSMEVLRGRVVRQRSAPHSPQQTCPQLHRTSSPSIILTNAHYGWDPIFKTFKDTAPGHLTHIFCHTVISKLYQFVMLSRASTPCFISSRSAPTWPSAAAKCAGVAPLPQHKLHETIRNLKQSQRPVQYLDKVCTWVVTAWFRERKCQPEATE